MPSWVLIILQTSKQTQMNGEDFAWTDNENMTWTTNYNEFSLDPLKAKQ